MLHGVASVQVLATAMSGFSRPASLSPVAFNIARAGARLIPLRSASLRLTAAIMPRGRRAAAQGVEAGLTTNTSGPRTGKAVAAQCSNAVQPVIFAGTLAGG